MYYDPYLAHYGVKGMKWGVRRYQNEDGTLTALGKKKARLDEARSRYAKTTGSSIQRRLSFPVASDSWRPGRYSCRR